MRILIFVAGLMALAAAPSFAQRLLLQSTTSTQNSGLYDYILPFFEAKTGIDVQVVAVGTGRAIRNAERGDGDVLLVHSLTDETAFVDGGFGIERFDVMYNDFVILGPESDPADLRAATSLGDALGRVLSTGAPFISRGDESGTHKQELALWARFDLDPQSTRYIESGSGMGSTIRMAVELEAYTLSDRATWLANGNQRDGEILYENAPPLHNQYGIIIVNPERHAHVNIEAARAFQDWLLGPEGQARIAEFEVGGVQLFFPNAAPPLN